jgi:hypothetical protein
MADPVVGQVDPSELRRGTESTLSLSGSELDGAVGATVSGERVAVTALSAESTRIDLTLAIGQRAAAGSRDLTLDFGEGGELVVSDAFDVVPGDVVLFGIAPPQATRGEAVTITLDGLNLDNIDTLSLGEGVAVVSLSSQPSDPTVAEVEIDVVQTAPLGLHDVVASFDDILQSRLDDAFEVQAGDILVVALTPDELTRGQAATLVANGANLDIVDQVALGGGIRIDSLDAPTPTQLELQVTALEESLPVGEARTVAFRGADGSFELVDGLTVRPGTVAVTRLRPDRASQGDSLEITVEGRNLDGLSRLSVGDDVAIESIDPLSPVKVIVEVTVADDAATGLRDVEVDATYGSVLLEDRFRVLERALPPVDLAYPDIIDAGTVEVGARKRISMVFVNDGEVTEHVLLEPVSGDVGDFVLFDPSGTSLDEVFPEVLEVTLGPFEEQIVQAEFRPAVQASSEAILDVVARDERVGGIRLRGSGGAAVLTFDPAPPIAIPPVVEGEVGRRQISTRATTGDRVLIEDIEVIVDRNSAAFPEGGDLTDVRLSAPLPPETDYLFGTTLITVETEYPRGSYEGEVWVHTDRPAAPILPIAFSTSVSAGADDLGDPAADAGDGGDEPADVAPDGGPDTGAPDTGRPDVGRPDTGDIDAGVDGAPADTGGPVAEEPPPEEGCCRQSPAGGSSIWSVGLLALLAVVARRSR